MSIDFGQSEEKKQAIKYFNERKERIRKLSDEELGIYLIYYFVKSDGPRRTNGALAEAEDCTYDASLFYLLLPEIAKRLVKNSDLDLKNMSYTQALQMFEEICEEKGI